MSYKTKELIRKLIHFLPLYRRERNLISVAFDQTTLEKAIRLAIRNVPYYKSYSQYCGDVFDITSFPLLRKKDIMGNERRFVSRTMPFSLYSKKETGGSTGQSLELYYSPQTIIKKEAMPQSVFSLIGDNLSIATLRGNRPHSGATFEVLDSRHILLSSYKLSSATIDDYIKLLNDYRIECLHVYPSSLAIFVRLAVSGGKSLRLPYLKGIVSSSEIFSKEDKLLVKSVLPNVKLIDYYSQNELACAAVSVDGGPYIFNNNYGYVEFRGTDERTPSGNRIAEIVATSIMNQDMPFIRYATEDYVELDSQGNVVSIIGRTSDFVVNLRHEVVPCIVCTRTKSMQNVISFQYYQDTVGKVVFRVKVSKLFTKTDEGYLLEDMRDSFEDMECEVCVVDEIEKTKRGKQLRMIQKLNINKYR